MNELAPESIASIVDESLLQDTIRNGQLSKKTASAGWVSYLELAQEAGASMVMVTCSTISSAPT